MAQVLEEGAALRIEGKRDLFLLDYGEIQRAYPNDPEMRLELALCRKALEWMMEAEFFLALMALGPGLAQHTLAATLPLEGWPWDFYRGLRQYHRGLAQNFREHKEAIEALMMTTLTIQARALAQHKAQESILEEALSDAKSLEQGDFDNPDAIDNDLISTLIQLGLDAAQEEDNRELEIDTGEKLQGGLLYLAQALAGRNNALFRDHPWGMILLMEVEWGGEVWPLGDIVVELLEEGAQEEVRPLLSRASRQMLAEMPHAINLYRTHREKLLAHHRISLDVVGFLEEEGDSDALGIYREFEREQGRMISPTDFLGASLGLALCLFSKTLTIPVSLAMATAGALDRLSSREAMLRGGTLGLNNFSQYERAHSLATPWKILPEFAAFGFVAIACVRSTPRPLLSALSARQTPSLTVGAHLRSILSRKRMENLVASVKGKMKDVNALPTAVASVLILGWLQVREEGMASLTDPEFMLTALIVTAIELVFVFKALDSGRYFLSAKHRNAMKEVSQIVFKVALAMQILYSQMQDEVKFRLERTFFEAAYDPLVGLTTTKIVLSYLANPFVGHLRALLPMMNGQVIEATGRFVLMGTKNVGGNALYLSVIDSTFNED